MTELEELYREAVMEHNWRPRNFGRLDGANRQGRGFNPLCGDTVTVYLKLEGDVIVEAAFEGAGCAISRASASLMTESVKGLTVARADKLFQEFHSMLTLGTKGEPPDGLGELEVLAGVSEYPVRVKCATLAWHTLRAAMKNERETTKTE